LASAAEALRDPLLDGWLANVAATLGNGPPPPPAAASSPGGSASGSIGGGMVNGPPAPAPGGTPEAPPVLQPATPEPSTPLLPPLSLPRSASSIRPADAAASAGAPGAPAVSPISMAQSVPAALPAPTGVPAPAREGPRPAFLQNLGRTPLPFEANVGHTDSQVRFPSRGPGFGLSLTATGAPLSLTRPHQAAAPAAPLLRDVLALQFAGADPSPQVVGEQELTSRSNYFTGADP